MGDAVDTERAGSQQTCLVWHSKFKFWVVRITMAGLTLCSRGTRCRGTAAQWHISVVTLKELFTAHRREHADSSMEEACISAFAQARSQNIYFSGEHFSFSVRVKSKLQGFTKEVQTPAVHSFELALEHRKKLLTVLDKSSRTIIELKSKLKQSFNTKKLAWQGHVHGMQKQLLGYISCELHNRKGFKTLQGRRFPLRYKQSVTFCQEGTMLLPWLTGLVVDKTKSNVEVQEGLRAFLDSDGSTSLQHFLRGAVHRHMSEPQLALEKAKPSVSVGNSARKRKSTCTKDRSASVGKLTGQEQSIIEEWGPRLRPRVK